jgi:hypothetical protein
LESSILDKSEAKGLFEAKMEMNDYQASAARRQMFHQYHQQHIARDSGLMYHGNLSTPSSPMVSAATARGGAADYVQATPMFVTRQYLDHPGQYFVEQQYLGRFQQQQPRQPLFPDDYMSIVQLSSSSIAPEALVEDDSSSKRQKLAPVKVRREMKRNHAPKQNVKEKVRVEAPRLRKRSANNELELNGECRLMITFLNYGKLPENFETFGAQKRHIPDGLCGSFVMYGETWKFEIKYREPVECEDGVTRTAIEWCVGNAHSELPMHCSLETASDVLKRHSRGITLCNKVFREGLEIRAREYEADIAAENAKPEPNVLRIKSYADRIKAMRPQRFAEGPLLFGLRHQSIQERYTKQD